jgi:hypothetical protein
VPSGAKIVGVDKVQRRIRHAATTGMREEYTRALMAEINEVETPECQRQTPVDTGALVSTVRTFGPEFRGNQVLAGTTAGGPEAPYAPIVHEDLEAFHRVGNAKFIERPYRESAPYLPARVAARMDMNRAFRG